VVTPGHQGTHRRTRQGGATAPPPNFGKPWKFGQTLGKIKNIRADLSENMLKSVFFITILHKIRANFQLPPGEYHPCTAVISTIYNMSVRVVSDIQTRAEGESLYIRYNTDANVVNGLKNDSSYEFIGEVILKINVV
jgi:hypothetical protein